MKTARVDVVPVTATHAEGLRLIMAPDAVAAWSRAHARELLGAGYVRLVVTEHVPTEIVGDRRAWRRR